MVKVYTFLLLLMNFFEKVFVYIFRKLFVLSWCVVVVIQSFNVCVVSVIQSLSYVYVDNILFVNIVVIVVIQSLCCVCVCSCVVAV